MAEFSKERRDFLRILASAGALGLVKPSLLWAQSANRGPIKNFVHLFLYGGADGRQLFPYKSGELEQELRAVRSNIYPASADVLDIPGLQIPGNYSPIGFHPSFVQLRDAIRDTGCGLAFLSEYGVTENWNFSHETAQRMFQAGQNNLNSLTKGWLPRLIDAANLSTSQVWGIGEGAALYYNAESERPLVLSSVTSGDYLSATHTGYTCDTCTGALKGASTNSQVASAHVVETMQKLAMQEFPAGLSDIEATLTSTYREFPEIVSLAKAAAAERPDRTLFGLPATGGSVPSLIASMMDLTRVIMYANSATAPASLRDSTKILLTSYGSWDAHTNIVSSYNVMIDVLSKALAGLVRTIHAVGALDSTVILVHTEFARTTRVNGSAGLDHAAANQTIMLGGKVAKRVIGPQASLTELRSQNFFTPQLPFTGVLRQILAQAGFTEAQINSTFPLRLKNESAVQGLFV